MKTTAAARPSIIVDVESLRQRLEAHPRTLGEFIDKIPRATRRRMTIGDMTQIGYEHGILQGIKIALGVDTLSFIGIDD
jgi:hypothetical protein